MSRIDDPGHRAEHDPTLNVIRFVILSTPVFSFAFYIGEETTRLSLNGLSKFLKPLIRDERKRVSSGLSKVWFFSGSLGFISGLSLLIFS